MEILKDSNYSTRDLNEAAVLLTMNRKLIELVRDGRQCTFVFENKNRCEEISKMYFFDKLLVDARSFVDSQNVLKNRIFAKE